MVLGLSGRLIGCRLLKLRNPHQGRLEENHRSQSSNFDLLSRIGLRAYPGAPLLGEICLKCF